MGTTCSTNIECDIEGSAVQFAADPDVVIAAIFTSAWLTFAIALFTYNLVDGVMEKDNPGIAAIDLQLRDYVLKKLSGTPVDEILSYIRVRVTRDKMQEVCLMFSDQQLVAGGAILTVGYMRHCEITQYHFYIAANLTLASFATYQSVLLIVRDVLKANIRRGWRLGWIAIVFGCVLAFNFVIYNDKFLVPGLWGLSMDCLWRQLPSGLTPRVIPYVVVGTVVDLMSAYSIVSCLYPEINDFYLVKTLGHFVYTVMCQPTYLYRRVEDHVDQRSKFRWLWKLVEWPTWLLFVMSFTLREIFASLYFDLARIFAYLFQTTYVVGWARDNAAINGREGPEDTWGFGQILPLLLLALPLFSFVEIVCGAPRISNLAS
ncbi:hypothetical protein PFICI_09872 [Pestalotiopsis fici W106-1]|uniref:Uncharacterized protein n=1 Tax=Pestalotiopsis fici (strain W106-1 / CGMCC3.15140) TaxID=1229662 RepID=W3WVD8_PESFW|nr:uncharacterized protein PFICI_09872 [Pestalotiopsis fici W106-1]ETS77810.1 hypothetical protein PFICI_09872 [Pestalotiopsis fici W106-1]